jgi:hypothetical protein
VTPGVLLAVMLAYSARHNGGGGRAAKPVPPPLSPTPLPATAPLATPPHGGPPGPGRRRQAHPQMGTTAPPDGDDGAPGWGRLCPASGSIDHQPCIRPPWLSTTGIARGGGEGGAMPGGEGGSKGGGRPGVGRHRDAVPPRILVAVRRLLWRGQGSYIGNNG